MPPWPRLVAFDLDGTVWSPDMYELWGGGSPFTVVNDGTHQLRDRSGQNVRLLGVIGQILHDLRHDPSWEGTICAVVSCTDEPRWADECLHKFVTTPGKEPLITCFDSLQIFKANKKQHFQRLKKEFPNIDYSEMIFFDNEHYNITNTQPLGVHAVYCPDGMTKAVWEKGLESYAKTKM